MNPTSLLLLSILALGQALPQLGGNGEAVCEGHGLTSSQCLAKGCCQWDDGQCWSAVGAGPCGSGGSATTAATTAPGGAATTAATGTNSTSGRQTFPLTTSPASSHSKFTKVFGVAVFGHSSISDAKFQHVASVLAEWLDNDEDGCVDIPTVLAKLLAAKAATVAEKSDPGVTDAISNAGYELASVTYNSELLPACAGTAATSACADATLEEVLHMVTAHGYAAAFPATFGESNEQASTPSLMTAAMDVARGGKFTSIPSSYPSTAWYTYSDATCKYNCMATEYVYWGISAMVGSIAGRASTIADEWKLATKATFLAGDTKLAAILQDTSTYRTPTISPNGQYAAPTTCSTGASSGGTLA